MGIFGRKRIAKLEDELEETKCSRDRFEKYTEEYQRIIEALNSDIKDLTNEINANVDDCKVGAWCKDCKHHNVVRFGNINGIKNFANLTWVDCGIKYDKYYYCSKHLREICPEFEKEE